MTDIELSQADADALKEMEKHCIENTRYDYPSVGGGALTIPLQSADRREQFLLDISRGRINLAKGKYQNRAHKVIVLVRLDLGGGPHRNPDDEEIPCPHLHLYKKGYGDKWAIPVPESDFSNIADLWTTLEDFMRYCNITRPPLIDRGLFL